MWRRRRFGRRHHRARGNWGRRRRHHACGNHSGVGGHTTCSETTAGTRRPALRKPPGTDDTAPPATTGGDEVAPLTDDYSQQIARLKEVTVDTSEFAKEPPYRVATIVQGPINGWGTIFDATMNARMEETGKFDMENRLYVPWDFDVANQQKGIEDAIAQGVDAIMLTSLSRAGLAASVERATAAGIPVILCMAGAETDEFTAEVSAEMPGWATTAPRPVARRSVARARSC